MIAVVADDFTGAAEIGGIGIRHNLRVVIETDVEKIDDVDILVIATNTRSMDASAAEDVIKEIIAKLIALKPDFIFKKIDSVLRGNIAAEICAQMEVSGKERALIIAGNPHFNRIIKDGIYYINGVPLAETSFASDPDYTFNSSSVLEALGAACARVISVKPQDKLSSEGLFVGDIESEEDMKSWSENFDPEMVLAGGAGFFNSLLSKGASSKIENTVPEVTGNKILCIFGSAYPKSTEVQDVIFNEEVCVSGLPDEIFYTSDFNYSVLTNWSNDIIRFLDRENSVLIRIPQKYRKEADLSERIRTSIGQLVNLVLSRLDLDVLFIEGGATAYSIFNALGIKRLFPEVELEPGIIQMKVDKFKNLKIITKPGSYAWPVNKIIINNEVSHKSDK